MVYWDDMKGVIMLDLEYVKIKLGWHEVNRDDII